MLHLWRATIYLVHVLYLGFVKKTYYYIALFITIIVSSNARIRCEMTEIYDNLTRLHRSLTLFVICYKSCTNCYLLFTLSFALCIVLSPYIRSSPIYCKDHNTVAGASKIVKEILQASLWDKLKNFSHFFGIKTLRHSLSNFQAVYPVLFVPKKLYISSCCYYSKLMIYGKLIFNKTFNLQKIMPFFLKSSISHFFSVISSPP